MIETSFGPSPFSLTLLIACLMTCDRFDWGERLKSKLGNSFLRYQASIFSFFGLICFSCFVCVITCLFRVGLCFLVYFEHFWLLELGFLFLLYFCVFRSSGQGLATHNLACACKLDCVRRPILACVCHCLETLIFFFCLFVLFPPSHACSV